MLDQNIEREYWESNYTLIKEEFIPISDVYVYIEDETLLGFISIMNKEFIGAIFVDVETQGKGIGKKLIQYATEKYGQLTLSVYQENIQAVNFYKHLGFKITSEEVNEDTQKMELFMLENIE